MIDFRYHVVSIVAVFLAGAVGLVLGTTTINGVVLKDLRGRVNELTDDKSALRGQLSDAQSQLTRDDTFVAAAEQPLIAGRLTGHRVAVVEVPGASDDLANRLAQAVLDAGAEVVSEIKITDSWVDPSQAARLDNLVTSLAPAGVAPGQDGSPAQRAATVLGRLAMSRKPGAGSLGLAQFLTGLEGAHMVKLRGGDPRPADLALVVSAPGRSDGVTPSPSATSSGEALLDLVGSLDTAGEGAVVAGTADATRSGGLLAAVRRSGISDTVSTVDSVDTPRGVVAAVFALAAQPRGDAGAYGQAAAGDVALPDLGP